MTPVEIIAEFRKKYEGTFLHVQMPDSCEDNLFYLASITQVRGEVNGTMKLESEEFGKIQLNMGTAHTLKFKFPRVGVYQCGADAFFFRRDPRRQWQRGLASGNCKIVPVWSSIRGSMLNLGEVNFTNVNAAFVGTTYGYQQALSMLESGKFRSVALERDFSVCLSPCELYPYLLLYRTLPIATLNKNGSVKTILEAAFEPNIAQITP